MMSNKKTILKKCLIDPGPLNVGDDTLTGALKINCNANIFSKIVKNIHCICIESTNGHSLHLFLY